MSDRQRVGILGSGVVGITLANGLSERGYTVALGNRRGSPVDGWSGNVGTLGDVADGADLLVLALKGAVAEKVVSDLGAALDGKVVIDATNPIADTGADEGVLPFFTTLDDSLMERLQKAAPAARFVKAFNSVGSAYMVAPAFHDVARPVMFICGNDGAAKTDVTHLLDILGWDAEDFGGVKSARAIEPLCMLWCLPGLLRNQWNHAFTVVKA